MGRLVAFTITANEPVIERASVIAKKLGVSRSEFVRQALEAAVEQAEERLADYHPPQLSYTEIAIETLKKIDGG